MSEASDPRRPQRKWLRRLSLALLALIVIGFVGLESLRWIGHRRGIELVPLPANSEIRARSVGADYVDAYRAPLRDSVSIDVIDRLAFQRGDEVAADENELVFTAGAPGLRFLVSYYLVAEEPDRSVTVSTAVFYESFLGRLYFTPVKQVHRRGLPFIVSAMVAEASEPSNR